MVKKDPVFGCGELSSCPVIPGTVFPTVYASWMTSCLWGTPTLMRSGEFAPSRCPQSAPAPSPPSLKSSSKWCRLFPSSLGWKSSGPRSECWYTCERRWGGVGGVQVRQLEDEWRKLTGDLGKITGQIFCFPEKGAHEKNVILLYRCMCRIFKIV